MAIVLKTSEHGLRVQKVLEMETMEEGISYRIISKQANQNQSW
jgi:hypothetical protein